MGIKWWGNQSKLMFFFSLLAIWQNIVFIASSDVGYRDCVKPTLVTGVAMKCYFRTFGGEIMGISWDRKIHCRAASGYHGLKNPRRAKEMVAKEVGLSRRMLRETTKAMVLMAAKMATVDTVKVKRTRPRTA